jgi:Amiloride-sensitive sodium channel
MGLLFQLQSDALVRAFKHSKVVYFQNAKELSNFSLFLFSCSVSLDYENNFIFPDILKEANIAPLDGTIPWSASSETEGLTLNTFSPLYDQRIEVDAREGYHFIIHPTDEFPDDLSFQFYQRSQFSLIEFTPHQVLMEEKLKLLSIQRRNCYLKNEKSLQTFKIYSKRNCEHECQSQSFAEKCGCVPFYLLSLDNLIIFLFYVHEHFCIFRKATGKNL